MKKRVENKINKIQQIKFTVVPILREKDVLKCGLFGSYALGEETKDSDVDLIVELPKNKTLLDLVDLQFALEAALKKKVDIITYKSLSPLIKETILKEQIPII